MRPSFRLSSYWRKFISFATLLAAFTILASTFLINPHDARLNFTLFPIIGGMLILTILQSFAAFWKAARAEADALRKAAVALSQNLAMDAVLDSLLQCIAELIPFDRAAVLFLEDGLDLMIARETPCSQCRKRIGLAVKVSDNPWLQQVLVRKEALLISEVRPESHWTRMPPLDDLQSWVGVPLVASDQSLGVLSLGSHTPRAFTSEHVRLAESLAIPAAVAIQNARTHERAAIFASELERRLG